MVMNHNVLSHKRSGYPPTWYKNSYPTSRGHNLCTSDVSSQVAFLMFRPNDCKELFVKALPCCFANACVFSAKVRAGASIWQEEGSDLIYNMFSLGKGWPRFGKYVPAEIEMGLIYHIIYYILWLRSNQETPSAIFSIACRRMGPASSSLPGMMSRASILDDNYSYIIL